MKQNQFSVLICLLLFFGGIQCYAQEHTMASGGNASGSGGTVSYSIGQIDYVEASGSGGFANQGVQQPIEIYSLGVDENNNIELTTMMYPNPTTNFVTLSITNELASDLSYHLSDLNGRIIKSDVVRSNQTTISMEELQAATYFLVVANNQSPLKIFKLIKN